MHAFYMGSVKLVLTITIGITDFLFPLNTNYLNSEKNMGMNSCVALNDTVQLII